MGGVLGALCAFAAVRPLCIPTGCSVGRKRAMFAFPGGSWAVVFTCSTCSWASSAQLFLLCCTRFVGPSWELSWGKRAFAGEGCLGAGYGMVALPGAATRWAEPRGAHSRLMHPYGKEQRAKQQGLQMLVHRATVLSLSPAQPRRSQLGT